MVMTALDDLLERMLEAVREARERDEVVAMEDSRVMIAMNGALLKDGSADGFMKVLRLR